jgi:isopenicillin N synthase-like dioxygenase
MAMAGASNAVDGFTPLIDLAAARDPAKQPSVADRVYAACEESGFFLITGHNVPDELVGRMDAVTREFFRLPASDKQRVAAQPTDPLRRGWDAPETARTAATRGIQTPPDLVEMFKADRLGEQGADGDAAGNSNRWPAAPANLRATWLEYYDAMTSLRVELIRLFAFALGLPGWFEDKIHNHNSVLAANYYPPQPEPPLEGQYRRGPHSDYGTVTILYRDRAPGGLEVCDKDGNWHSVPLVDGAFVVNIGDLMAALTGGRWVSSLHRAVNPPRELANTERISIPYFGGVNPDMPVVPIGSTASADPPPLTAFQWIKQRMDRTYSS